MMTYQVDYWYCRQSDPPETPIHDTPQMMGGAPHGTDSITETITSLLAQGYRVQQVEVYAVCGRCDGSGRVPKRPKGARKDRPYQPVYVSCGACVGGTREYPRLRWPL